MPPPWDARAKNAKGAVAQRAGRGQGVARKSSGEIDAWRLFEDELVEMADDLLDEDESSLGPLPGGERFFVVRLSAFKSSFDTSCP